MSVCRVRTHTHTPGVPQLSVGTKAILTATPDYVSFAIARRDVEILTCFGGVRTHGRTARVASLR